MLCVFPFISKRSKYFTSGNNNRVISLGVRGFDITFQQEFDSKFGTTLDITLLVDSHNTDEVLTVAGMLQVNVGVGGHF